MEKQKINNPNYRKFLDDGEIEFITPEMLDQALSNIKGRNVNQGRALLIALYYTGARPNEVLRIKAKDIERKKNYVTIKVKGSKKGLPRTIYLKFSNKHVKELYKYAQSLMPEILIFFNYISNYERESINKKGEIKKRVEISDVLRWHVKKWFENVIKGSITPYYLRHNRFSKLAANDVKMDALRMLKGSRTYESVTPYLHMSSIEGKKLAKKIE